jgi:hypothetical protein
MTDDDRRAPEAPDEAEATAPAAQPEKPAAPDYSVEVSPRQLAGGFAIVAALLVLLVRSRRRRGRKSDANRDAD